MEGSSDVQLVTRQGLEALIDGLEELAPYKEFMRERWVGMVMWWHTRSLEARRKYFALRAVIVVGGVSIPVLSTLSLLPGLQQAATIAIAVVGAVVAGCAAWEGFANYGETWRGKRRAAELLKVEGWQFLQLCGKYQAYRNHKKAYPHFAAEVEQMIAGEVGVYLAVFAPSLEEIRTAAQGVNAEIMQAVRPHIPPD